MIIYARFHVHTYIYACIYKCIFAYICVYLCIYTCMYAHRHHLWLSTLTAMQSSWFQTVTSWIQTFRPWIIFLHLIATQMNFLAKLNWLQPRSLSIQIFSWMTWPDTSKPSVLKAVRSTRPWPSSSVLLAEISQSRIFKQCLSTYYLYQGKFEHLKGSSRLSIRPVSHHTFLSRKKVSQSLLGPDVHCGFSCVSKMLSFWICLEVLEILSIPPSRQQPQCPRSTLNMTVQVYFQMTMIKVIQLMIKSRWVITI